MVKTEDLQAIRERALADLEAAGSEAAIEAIRVAYLGRKGLLPEIMRGLGSAPPSDRAAIGQEANTFKRDLAAAIQARREVLNRSERPRAAVDVTLPGAWLRRGAKHPVSRVIEEAAGIFATLGFTVAEGPDIETPYHNFEALNTPAHHPSLDALDTFWLGPDRLLRTQTSPVQIRVMESHPPPVRIITPGRCYRRDTTDATHSANFHQIEGLYVDARVSMADLKGTLAYFARALMGASVGVRFRPHYFPFTEPSVECDFSCHVCEGRGCRVCKQSGWIEIAGAGMVDPRVFAKVGYDPERWCGYAFGMGVERIAMVKYGIPDIRMLYDNDLRVLSRFI